MNKRCYLVWIIISVMILESCTTETPTKPTVSQTLVSVADTQTSKLPTSTETHTMIPPTATNTHTPSPIPPTETSTIPPKTNTPAPTKTIGPTPVPITQASDLVGTWFGPGTDGMAHVFFPDGTCKSAFLLEKLLTSPNVVCTYKFEEGHFVYTVIRESGVQHCAEATAIYDIVLLENGNIKFIVVLDNCIQRFITIAREHEPVY